MTTAEYSNFSEYEEKNRKKLLEFIKSTPIFEEEFLNNIGLYMTRQNLMRILYVHEIFQKILFVHGDVFEFGVRWGQNMSLFTALRGIYEPYNYSRRIIGFDTFAGFSATDDAKDGIHVASGDLAVPENYDEHLNTVLEIHESENPISHIRKFDLVKGDATLTLPKYIEDNPHTIVALAYFDFDIYYPTKECLMAILPRMPKGGILAFDELNCKELAGETLAVLDTIGLQKYRLHRSPLAPFCSYMTID